ncbi:unnamed protein product [Amoebophrya sp. A120]|nr:unnamed protein product [Amoebophrya sp. A120]|eukprot:GSA120T00017543001.1
MSCSFWWLRLTWVFIATSSRALRTGERRLRAQRDEDLLAPSAKQIMQGTFMRGPATLDDSEDSVPEGATGGPENAVATPSSVAVGSADSTSNEASGVNGPSEELAEGSMEAFFLGTAKQIEEAEAAERAASDAAAAAQKNSAEQMLEGSVLNDVMDVHDVALKVQTAFYTGLAYLVIYVKKSVEFLLHAVVFLLNPQTVFQPIVQVWVYLGKQIIGASPIGHLAFAVAIAALCFSCFQGTLACESMSARHRMWRPIYLRPSRQDAIDQMKKHVQHRDAEEGTHSEKMKELEQDRATNYRDLHADRFPVGTFHASGALHTEERQALVFQVEPLFRPWKPAPSTAPADRVASSTEAEADRLSSQG